jgi:hypothetical protein
LKHAAACERIVEIKGDYLAHEREVGMSRRTQQVIDTVATYPKEVGLHDKGHVMALVDHRFPSGNRLAWSSTHA